MAPESKNAKAKCGILIFFLILFFTKRINAENTEVKVMKIIVMPLYDAKLEARIRY